MVLTLVACGEPAAGPALIDRRLGGEYVLVRLEPGDASSPAGPVVFQIDAEHGELRIDSGCGLLLGSYSLLDDGRAGLTIAGGSRRGCTPADEARERVLIDAVGRIERWSETESGLAFESPAGDVIELAR